MKVVIQWNAWLPEEMVLPSAVLFHDLELLLGAYFERRFQEVLFNSNRKDFLVFIETVTMFNNILMSMRYSRTLI